MTGSGGKGDGDRGWGNTLSATSGVLFDGCYLRYLSLV